MAPRLTKVQILRRSVGCQTFCNITRIHYGSCFNHVTKSFVILASRTKALRMLQLLAVLQVKFMEALAGMWWFIFRGEVGSERESLYPG